MRSLLKNISIACIPLLGIVLALGVVEIAVRLFLPSPNNSGPGWNDRPLFYFRSPGAPAMQDYPYQRPKTADKFRIAAIGDSFTFAPYMQFTDTYVKKLEAMLNLKDGGRTAEVINYGVPAYSTSHEVSVTAKALEEGADMILLQITLNDPEIKKHTPSGIRENMDDRFGALRMTGLMGNAARYWKTLAYVMTRLHNTKTHRAYINYFTNLFENPRTWNPFVESMRALVGTARTSKKPIVAVVFPLFGIPMTESYPFHGIHAKVDALMAELQVPLLDLSSMYQGIPLERLQVIPGVDRHPNEIAHRMAAEQIYLWLEELKLLPSAHLIPEKFATRLGIDAQRVWEPPPATPQAQ
jgi:lysophospholipase L1-like esterase